MEKEVLLPEHTYVRYHSLLFWLCWAAYTTAYLGRLNYAACLAQIVEDLSLSRVEGGAIGTAFFVVYGIGQLVNGFAGDRISPTWMIFCGLAGSGAVNMLFSASHSAQGMVALWSLNGFFQSLLWSPIIRILSEWFRPAYRMRACVKINTTVPVGTVAVYLLSVAFIAAQNWRGMFRLAGGLLLVMAAVWNLWTHHIRKQRVFEEDPGPRTEVRPVRSTDGFSKLLLGSGLPLLAGALLAQGILKEGITSWVPTYVEETYHLSAALSVFGTMFLPLANLGGVYLADGLNRRWVKNELLTCCYLFAANAGLILLLKALPLGAGAAYGVLALSTTTMMGVNTMLLSALPVHFSAMHKSSSVSGMLNFCIYIGSAVSTAGTGWLSTVLGWQKTIFIWAVVALIGGVSCLAAKKRWNRFTQRNLGTERSDEGVHTAAR